MSAVPVFPLVAPGQPIDMRMQSSKWFFRQRVTCLLDFDWVFGCQHDEGSGRMWVMLLTVNLGLFHRLQVGLPGTWALLGRSDSSSTSWGPNAAG